MWVKRASLILVVVALVTQGQHINEEHLRSSQASFNSTSSKIEVTTRLPKLLLNEYFDHAELKQSIKEGADLSSEREHTTETLLETGVEPFETLPTPVAVTHEEPESEDPRTEKKFSVPKKGVEFKKPSVVAKKGAAPESSTQSVSPRKGVELSEANSAPAAGNRGQNITSNGASVSGKYSSDIAEAENSSQIFATNDEKNLVDDPRNMPIPHLVQASLKPDNNSPPVGSNPLKSSTTLTALHVTSISHAAPENIANSGSHPKPMTADDLDGANSQDVSYATIVLVVGLVVAIVLVVAVVYHKLKDIWMRRHYDYVDFLVDGMYE